MMAATREFIEIWECKKHNHLQPGGCWGSSHLTLADVKVQAAECAETCLCWRHRVIDWMEP